MTIKQISLFLLIFSISGLNNTIIGTKIKPTEIELIKEKLIEEELKLHKKELSLREIEGELNMLHEMKENLNRLHEILEDFDRLGEELNRLLNEKKHPNRQSIYELFDAQKISDITKIAAEIECF